MPHGVGVEMVERTVRFTVPSTEAILPANLFKVGVAASIAAATTAGVAAPAAIAAPVTAADEQFMLDFARDTAPAAAIAASPLTPAVAVPEPVSRVIDIVAEDVTSDTDEFGVIDLESDPSTDDVIATARRFARAPAE